MAGVASVRVIAVCNDSIHEDKSFVKFAHMLVELSFMFLKIVCYDK